VRVLLVLALVVGCGSTKSRAARDAAPPAALTVGRDRVRVGETPVPDKGGAIDRAALALALEGRTGTVPVVIAPDATYVRLVQAMDVVFAAGLDGELDVGRGGPQPAPRPVAAAQPIDDAPTLLLIVSTDAIFLGAERVTRIADIPAGEDIAALADAIGRRPERPTRLAVHADNATPGALLVRVIGTARRAGVADVPFILRFREPRPMPTKRAPVP
jgi:hypothetical protein